MHPTRLNTGTLSNAVLHLQPLVILVSMLDLACSKQPMTEQLSSQ